MQRVTMFEDEMTYADRARLAFNRIQLAALQKKAKQAQEKILLKMGDLQDQSPILEKINSHNEFVTDFMQSVTTYYSQLVNVDVNVYQLNYALWANITCVYEKEYQELTPQQVCAAFTTLMDQVKMDTAASNNNTLSKSLDEQRQPEKTRHHCILS